MAPLLAASMLPCTTIPAGDGVDLGRQQFGHGEVVCVVIRAGKLQVAPARDRGREGGLLDARLLMEIGDGAEARLGAQRRREARRVKGKDW